nr:hypothetical protein Iba_chr15eCG7560 [Ipomoea batatas]
MSQKTLPSANNSLSLFTSSISTFFFCSPLDFFLILFLSSASLQSNFSSSVSGEIWLTGADFPVTESRATKVKFAVRAKESEVSAYSREYLVLKYLVRPESLSIESPWMTSQPK